MSYLKNTSSQKFNVLAVNTATGLPVTGDAANITAKISIDSAAFAAVSDTNPTELDATNAPGVYVFDLSQAETNGDVLTIVPSSSTANVQMDMLNIYTTDLQVLEDTIWDASYGDHNNVGSTGRSVGNIATVQNSIDVVDANVDAILVDTGTDIPALIADVPTVAEFEARTLVAASYFDPAADTVANVTLVATTTTNTDMVGTNNAALASSLSITNSNVSGIKAKTDQLAFTVANQVDANSLTGGTSPADVADAVWDELQSSHTTVGTFGSYLDAQVSSTIHGTVEANLIQVQGQTVTLDDLNLFIDYWNPLQGNVLQLTQGDTYQTSINTQITITDTGFIDLSALSNTSCELTIRDLGTGQNILEDHQSVTVDNTTKTITFELTGTQTSGSDWLVHNNYKYRIAARFPTNKVVTLLRGSAIIADSLD